MTLFQEEEEEEEEEEVEEEKLPLSCHFCILQIYGQTLGDSRNKVPSTITTLQYLSEYL